MRQNWAYSGKVVQTKSSVVGCLVPLPLSSKSVSEVVVGKYWPTADFLSVTACSQTTCPDYDLENVVTWRYWVGQREPQLPPRGFQKGMLKETFHRRGMFWSVRNISLCHSNFYRFHEIDIIWWPWPKKNRCCFLSLTRPRWSLYLSPLKFLWVSCSCGHSMAPLGTADI